MSDPDRPHITVVPDPPPLPGRRPRLKKLRLMLILAGLTVLAGMSTVFGMMMAVASDLPQLDNRQEFDSAQNSVMTDVHGKFLGVLTDQGRVIVEHDDIALTMQHAIIAIEDQRFYTNDGVDLRGIGRAFVQDVIQRSAVQGGSTITQQFVKNATQAQSDRTILNKMREAALAYHLTRKWSKEKILTQYLNAVYFGNGAYGVEAAARTYFGNDVDHRGCGTQTRPCAKELKPHEAALIAGVVASPSGYDPVANPEPAKARRDIVLDKMLEQGYLTAAEHARSEAAPLPSAKTVQPPQVRSATETSGYFQSWVRQQVIERYGARRALEGGLRVQTTLDLSLQRAAEQAVKGWLGNPAGPAASLVAIDNRTGEVRAMVGGRDYDRQPFNLATQGQRQPGSAFKPFVLATALRSGVSPDSTWPSERLVIDVPDSPEKFTVNNYEDNYLGATTLARATTVSDNAVYAQVGIDVGTDRIASLAERMGIRTPVSSNYANTLGGLEQGVTPLDMAHAYQSFATGGLLVSGSLASGRSGPVGMRRVSRRRDPDAVIDSNRRERRRVLPEAVANQTTQMLESVIESGTAQAANLGTVRTWGKTGTTENFGDAWFVGATDDLTVAVWVGYPNKLVPMQTEFRGEPVAGGTYPAEIWQDFMLTAVESEQERLERRCARDKESDPEGDPPQSCIDAGLAADPSAPVPLPAPTEEPQPDADADAEQPEPDGDNGAGEPAPDRAPPPTGGEAPPPAAPPPAPSAPTPAPAPAPTPVPSPGGATPQGAAG